MATSAVELILPDVKLSEGFRARPYRDTEGILTIGYGCNLDDGWSEWLAEQVCRAQLKEKEEEIRGRAWYVAADPVRQGVLLELAFNLGVPRLMGFRKMMAAVQLKDWTTAAKELKDSLWYKQVGPTRGDRLIRRLRDGIM